MKKILSLLIIFTLVSCSYAPIYGDNYKYKATSKEQREDDFKFCKEKADKHFEGVKMRRAGKEGVRKGAIGTIFGGIFAFFVGGNSRSLAKGLAVGAGAGAAIGAGSVLAEGKLKPDQYKQRYVHDCLNEKGYSVIGWE
jgi:hypothetical protein